MINVDEYSILSQFVRNKILGLIKISYVCIYTKPKAKNHFIWQVQFNRKRALISLILITNQSVRKIVSRQMHKNIFIFAVWGQSEI